MNQHYGTYRTDMLEPKGLAGVPSPEFDPWTTTYDFSMISNFGSPTNNEYIRLDQDSVFKS